MSMYDHLSAQIATTDQNIGQLLTRIRAIREATGQAVAAVVPPHPSAEKGRRMSKRGEEPMRQELARTFGIDLTVIEGIGVEAAACVYMEVGPDIPARFPTEHHLVSYLKLSPRLAISGGQPVHRKSKTPHRGSLPLKRVLLAAARCGFPPASIFPAICNCATT